MTSKRVGLAALAAAAIMMALLAWKRPHLVDDLLFIYRLLRAQRQANRFYAAYPWVTKNVAYHPALPRRLDVYRPEKGTNHPVIVYVYGGSWSSGNKELYAPAAQRFVPSGFVLVIPDYTLYPQAGYPRQTEEIAAALAWTLDHIAEYGGDPRRVVLVAQSAGAQISGLALLEPRWLAAYDHSAGDVRGFVGISGVYDFEAVLAYHRASPRARKLLSAVLGGEDKAGLASPIRYVSAQCPPALLIHGDADTTVPIEVGRQFHERLTAAGIPSEFVTYPKAGHADILFRALTEKPPRLVNDILSFVQRCTALPEGNLAQSPAPAPAATADRH
jgi:acetyl esterase/lipase